MKKKLQIVIFDGSFKTTPFIKRLVQGLLKNHNVAIFGFLENETSPINKVKYVALGSSDRTIRLLVLSITFAAKALFVLASPKQFLTSLRLIGTFQKKKLQQHNFNIAIKLCQPDIFHLQWPSLLPWCETLLSNPDIKVVLSQRGYQNNVRPFVTPENLAYLKSIYPKINGFHSVSKAMSVTGDNIWSASHKIDHVVYSGFDFSLLPFQKTYQKNSEIQLLSIGRPHWVKGYAYALQACVLLKAAGLKFHYTIVGAKGNEELVYRINEYGLNTTVTITDKISQQEVYNYMITQDVLLFPSIKEGLPNVVVEAMAVGMPVIATDCGGVSELLDEHSGIVIPPRNAHAIANGIISLAETSVAEINQRRLKARERVEIQHNEKRMVQDMEALYYKCLDSSC